MVLDALAGTKNQLSADTTNLFCSSQVLPSAIRVPLTLIRVSSPTIQVLPSALRVPPMLVRMSPPTIWVPLILQCRS
jgi:hypothetical protein